MNELLYNIERIVEYRTLISARILYLLVSFDSEATVEDMKQLIFEHDGRTHPSEFFVGLIELFRADEADVELLAASDPRCLELFPTSLPRWPLPS